MFMRSAAEAINNAPVICNHCFTKAIEHDAVFLLLRCLHNAEEM